MHRVPTTPYVARRSLLRSPQRSVPLTCRPSFPRPTDAGDRTDYGAWTLLHTDSTKGALQVFLHEKDPATGKALGKGQWIDADPLEDAFGAPSRPCS